MVAQSVPRKPARRRNVPPRRPVAVDLPAKANRRSDRWSSTPAFVLALAGAALGLRAFWQFPDVVARHGGGAFVLAYVLLALLVGVPLLVAQIVLGRRGRASPVRTFGDLAAARRGGRRWAVVGMLAVAGGFLVLSYLSVFAGWVTAYFVRALAGAFSGLTAEGVTGVFASFVGDPEKQLFWHAVFLAGVGLVTARGLQRGIEPAARWLVPAVYAALVVLLGYGAWIGGADEALRYLLTPDFSRLSPDAWLAALAQVFFSLGLGTGVALMYAAYLRPEASIPRAAAAAAGLDLTASIAAGIVVFAVLFAAAAAPAAGPGLLFQALPLAFDHVPLGRWFACLFFAVLAAAALLLGIALLEPVVVWLEERAGWRRPRAVLASVFVAWALGLATIFSFNYAAFSFEFLGVVKYLGAFDVLQTLTAEFVLPLVGLLTAVFAGWIVRTETVRADIRPPVPLAFDAWRWLMRVLLPPVLLVLLFSLYRLQP